MNLILWRHAHAEDISAGQRDEERSLTPKGLKQAHIVARWLKKHLPININVISSPSIRTCQTADFLDIPYETSQYLSITANAHDHLDLIAKYKGSNLLLIGHQPTLGQLASMLLWEEPCDFVIRKGGFLWLFEKNNKYSLRAALSKKDIDLI